MYASLTTGIRALVCASLLALGAAAGQTPMGGAAQSPWGAADEIGRLNMMTEASQLAILKRIASGKVYDLSVEYFIGMPSWYLLGDPRYHIWMTHTPQGTVVDNPVGVAKAVNDKVGYSGDAISMYTHTGTHMDTLNHFGLHGKLWNGFTAQEHLGDRGWTKAGAEKVPPMVARGVLLDVAATKGVAILPLALVRVGHPFHCRARAVHAVGGVREQLAEHAGIRVRLVAVVGLGHFFGHLREVPLHALVGALQTLGEGHLLGRTGRHLRDGGSGRQQGDRSESDQTCHVSLGSLNRWLS